ncbi:MAG: ComEA family DNA-binding protein [Gemmatimonadaceae bacterium]
MPTPAERRALIFVTGLLLLGAGVRAFRAVRNSPRDELSANAALRRHIEAVDSVRIAQRGRPRKSGSSRAPRTQRSRQQGDTYPPLPLDLDIASAGEIERLPRIGKALAERIVADRDSFGPFGSLEEFIRVKGVGPAMAKTVAPHVTFSLQRRPQRVDDRGPRANHSDDRIRRRGRRRSP